MGIAGESSDSKEGRAWAKGAFGLNRTVVLLLTGLIVIGAAVLVYLSFVRQEDREWGVPAYLLPVAENALDDTAMPPRMIVNVDLRGKLYIYNRPVTIEQFRYLLHEYRRGLGHPRPPADPGPPVVLRAGGDLEFGAVWAAVAPCQEEGFCNLHFSVIFGRPRIKGYLAFKAGAEYKPDAQAIDLSVSRGAYNVNGRPARGETLQAALETALAGSRTAPVRVVASADATHQEVVRALDAFAGAGRRDVTIFVTEKSSSQEPSP